MRHETLDEWAQWMAAVGSSDKTVRLRVQGVEGLARHAGISDPAAVTTRQIIAWLAPHRSPWTRQTYWYTVTAWGRFLVEQGHRDDDPAARIPRPPTPRSTPRPVDDQTIARMLNNPASTRAYAYTVLAVFAGLRVHEIAQLQGSDIRDGWLHIRGKGGHDAAVPVHPRIARLASGMPDGYWFPGSERGHVRGVSVSLTISAALRAAGSSASAHALRHSYGTKLMRQSRNLRTTQSLMRHQSVATTERYTLVSDRDQVEAIRRLDWGDAA